jgi:hypothetical protein
MDVLDAAWVLRGLGAGKPFGEQEEKLSLFGQFVGDWIGEATFIKEDGSEVPGGKGEVHFRWILEGRAVQDVWMSEDPVSKTMVPGGTTLRFYDSERDVWQSTWISPKQNTTLTFTGREVGGEIVLEAVNKRGRLEHWIFYDIKKGSSFRWRGEGSSDGGRTWKPYARYSFRRSDLV